MHTLRHPLSAAVRSPRVLLIPLAAVVVVAFSNQCANLNPLQPGVCGNGVVDPGEDCDRTAQTCGQPGTPFACRFNCAGTTVCPSGYNCGADSICRAPSGQFAPLGSPVHTGGQELVMGDFNGDGFADAYIRNAIGSQGQSSSQVVYLASDGSILGTFPILDDIGSPFVGDINADGLSDLVGGLAVGAQTGITVFLGQKTTSLAPQPFPAITLPVGLNAARVLAVDGFKASTSPGYFLGTSAGPVTRGLYFPAQSAAGAQFGPDASPAVVEVPMPVGPGDVAGRIALTRLLPTDPCPDAVMVGQRVLGGATSAFAYVVQPCSVQDGGTALATAGPTVTKVQLPPPATGCVTPNQDCGTGAFVADVNGDEILDIIVTATSTTNPAEYATYVGLGDGQGNYGLSQAGRSAVTGPLTLAVVSGGAATLGRTLAVADLNDDGVADFVAEGGVAGQLDDGRFRDVVLFMSLVTPADAGFVIQYQRVLSGNTWASAAIGDFDNDGTLDLVAASQTAPEIEFYSFVTLPDRYSLARHAALPTDGNVDNFTVGDFDGDGISDLAFVQVDPARDGTHDVAIAYGVAGGFPNSFVVAGRYPKVLEMSAVPPFPQLTVIAEPPFADAGLTSSVFNTDVAARPPLASQALRSPGQVAPKESVLGAAVGSFRGVQDASSPLDIVALGEIPNAQTPGIDSFWFMPNQGPISLPSTNGGVTQFGVGFAGPYASPNPAPLQVDPLGATAGVAQAVLMTAASLHGTDPASLVAVSTCGDFSTATCSTPNAVLSVESLSGGTIASTAYPLPAGVTVAQDGQIALVDLDGDGYKDLILLTGTSAAGFCPASGSVTTGLMVFWGSQQSGFDLTSPTVLASCQECGDAGVQGSSCPVAFTTLTTRPTGPPTLAYLAGEGLTFASFESGAHSATTTIPRLFASLAGDAAVDAGDAGVLVPATTFGGIAAGDINGDGVDDLAITAKGILYLYQGVPVNK